MYSVNGKNKHRISATDKANKYTLVLCVLKRLLNITAIDRLFPISPIKTNTIDMTNIMDIILKRSSRPDGCFYTRLRHSTASLGVTIVMVYQW